MLPPRIQYRYSQELQISTVNIQNSYLTQVTLNNFAKKDHFWCLKNLRISNGQNVRFQEDQLIIQTDASTKKWGVYCTKVSKGGEGGKVKKITAFCHKHLWTIGSQNWNFYIYEREVSSKHPFSKWTRRTPFPLLWKWWEHITNKSWIYANKFGKSYWWTRSWSL